MTDRTLSAKAVVVLALLALGGCSRTTEEYGYWPSDSRFNLIPLSHWCSNWSRLVHVIDKLESSQPQSVSPDAIQEQKQARAQYNVRCAAPGFEI